jgi:ABC-type Zn uptake system ZnuABC Zn-binding protein ZnuA
MSFSIVSSMRSRCGTLSLCMFVLLVVVGCGEDDGAPTADSRGGPRVVATTTQAADLARNVGGPRVEVTSLLSPNTDPHGYELRPRDVDALTGADLVIRSGGDLDEWAVEAIESAGAEGKAITLMDSVQTIEGGHGHEEEGEHAGEEESGKESHEEEEEEEDPHWWQDPRNAMKAVTAIETRLAKADPDARGEYAKRADSYRAEIKALDEAVAACWAQVPRRQRKLVTTHDALGYYANRYGIEVVGTVIPSLSTTGQPSAGELAELVETIRREQVRTVFAESSVNSKVERAIADEAGARVGKPLWADTLGPAGSDGATYLRSIASNTQAMVDGVTGGSKRCKLPAG